MKDLFLKVWFSIFPTKKVKKIEESSEAKNFYGNFKTEEDLRKEIGRLSHCVDSPPALIVLLGNTINGFRNMQQIKKKVIFTFREYGPRYQCNEVNIYFKLTK